METDSIIKSLTMIGTQKMSNDSIRLQQETFKIEKATEVADTLESIEGLLKTITGYAPFIVFPAGIYFMANTIHLFLSL